MTREQTKAVNAFQDAVGALVDDAIRDGMDLQLIRTVLSDEASHLHDRKKELVSTPEQKHELSKM